MQSRMIQKLEKNNTIIGIINAPSPPPLPLPAPPLPLLPPPLPPLPPPLPPLMRKYM